MADQENGQYQNAYENGWILFLCFPNVMCRNATRGKNLPNI